MNVAVIRGHLSSTPVARTLASGSTLVSLEVTTTTADGSSASVPVAWFDPSEVPDWEVGTEVVVRGIVKRRFYRAGEVTQSRTEVVAAEVEPAARRRQVAKLLGRALASFE